MEQKQKRENVVAGIVGAFLGSLIGVACTVVIGQMGYVASISGLVMAVCALKGYEMLGGTLSKKGAAVSSVLILAMTYFAHRLTWAIAIVSELKWGILEAYRAIPYLLERNMLEETAYWGDLAMLYLFTLLGAVPTILGGLRGASMPELPNAGFAPVGAEAAEAVFYPAERKWTRMLRLSSSLSMLPGLLGGIALIAAACAAGAPIPLSMAALGCIASSFVMMCFALPRIQISQADTVVFARISGRLWRINLNGLNAADTYRFTKKSGNLRALRWEKLTPEEQERAKASILRAAALLTGGQVLPGSALSLTVLPMTDLELIKETKWSWVGRYSLYNGKRKKVVIAKAYPDFSPVPGVEPPQEPVFFRWGLLALALAAAVLLGAGGYGLGTMLENAISGGSRPESSRREPAAGALTARVPESVSRFETGGVLYQVDSAFQLTSVNAFHDPATDTDYRLAVQTGADQEKATDALLQPISDYRMSPRYGSFSFAHAGAEETLVPLTAADGTVYQYEILSLYLTDGESVHVGAALAGDGLLVTVEARASAGADAEDVRGNILYILENLRRTGAVQVEITEDNYQALFHLAEELDYAKTAVGYIKAPYEMFGHEAFVDVHVPYSEAPVFLEEGYALRSAAHGMEVTATIAVSGGSAEAVVDQAYEAMKNAGADIYEDGVSDTTYFEEYDIAVKQVLYFEDNRTKPRVAILYADYKQEGCYLSAQITYLPEQMDDDYPALRQELSSAYALTLPELEPMSGS